MCGVAGIVSYGIAANAPVERTELRAIRDHMERRGPDGMGEWFSSDQRVGLAHRRLSIIDLSDRAAQPMATPDGKLVISFNGEIYNHQALRSELVDKGYVFRTTSDTEVLLHLYADRGEAMLRDLRGMFAFALWDETRKAMLLARDPYGIKPLYYADDGQYVRLASQVKALLAGGRVSRTPKPAGIVGFYLFGSVPEPHTTYDGIAVLPAGSYLWIDAQGPTRPTQYFSIAAAWRQAARESGPVRDREAVFEQARVALLDSVRHHMVADVPVGAFLSAGVDSGALVGLMSQLGAKASQAITLSFAEFAGGNDDEAPLAAEVARAYGIEHHVRMVTQSDFAHDWPAILNAMDQPTIDGVNTWFVSKATAEHGLKVAISGLGGDELLGGYRTFDWVPAWVSRMQWPSLVPSVGRALRRISAPLLRGSHRLSPKVAGMAEYGGTYAGAYLLKRGLFMPWELSKLLPPDFVEEGLRMLSPLVALNGSLQPDPGTAFGRVASLESCHYMRNQLLRDTDWASMAHSLEVRVPLVDPWLLKALGPLLLGAHGVPGKSLLGRAPQPAIPSSLQNRAKTGFSTPLQDWLLSTADVDAWQRVPLLTARGCHWSRRFAYAVGSLLLPH